jgi:hypothetical protein
MGIKDFNKCIKKEYPNAYKKNWQNAYDNVYIDLNFALHRSTDKVKKINEMYSKLFKFVENILLDLNPKKKICFTSDGSAPLAKLLEQRKRRQGASKKSSDVEASSILFTPGTEFMTTLKEKMKEFMLYLSFVFNVDVEFLDEAYDEAELKLKKKIMDGNPDESHIFVSNDADVILMLTTLENFKNIYIYDKSGEILSILKLIDDHTTKVGMTQNPGLDFTAVNMLLGNDYLPKVQYIDFYKLWNSYKTVAGHNIEGLIIKTGTNDITVNISFLKKMLAVLVTNLKQSYIKKPHLKELMGDVYKNYYDGFTWCMTTYVTGVCIRYNYMYGYKDVSKPHPLGLLFCVDELENMFNMWKLQQSLPLSPTLYSILLLPKSWSHLIDKKYQAFANKEKSLYVTECCEKCKYFNNKINELNTKVQFLESNKKESDITKQECVNVSKNLSLHKKQHEMLTFEDIEEIRCKFEKI